MLNHPVNPITITHFKLFFCFYIPPRLDKVSNVLGHLLNLSVVESLKLLQSIAILLGDEVDGNTLTTETTTTTNSVDVVLLGDGEIKVDDKGDLLNIDTTGQQIGGNQDTGRTRSELLHDSITLGLVHLTVNGRDGELLGSKTLGNHVDLSLGVAENNGLGDRDGLVQVAENLELVLLLVNVNVELLDTFKGKLILLDKNADGVTHELGGDLKNILGHGGGQENDLDLGGEVLENVVNLGLETTGQHLIGLIEDEHLDGVGVENSTADNVVDTAGGTDNDVNTSVDSSGILLDGGTTDTGVADNAEGVTKTQNDLLDLEGKLTSGSKEESLGLGNAQVNVLENRDREGSGLTGTGLSLGKNIVTLDNGENSTLLNGRGRLETVSVDTCCNVLEKETKNHN